MTDFLPFAKPDIGQAEIDAVVGAMSSGWITTGKICAAFEQEFAEYVGGEVEAIAVNSATAGLHLALEACGIGEGDEVIVPTWTFTASAEVVRYLGATPVLVDVDPTTFNIDMKALAEAVTPQTKAVVVVHMAGLSVDMKKIHEIVADKEIRIIEDAAHALPSVADGVRVGSTTYSDAAVFSFYATKTMTTGEGGMVTTTDPAIARRIRVMRLHGIDRDVFDRYSSTRPAWAYDIVAPGYKYNLTDTAAAMGRVQLQRSDEMRDKRDAIAARYNEQLQGLPLQLPTAGLGTDLHAWHLYMVRVTDQSPLSRDDLISQMSGAGIGTSVHFIPLHRHTYWRESLSLEASEFPAAEAEFARVLSLPIFSSMREEDVDRVISTLHELLA